MKIRLLSFQFSFCMKVYKQALVFVRVLLALMKLDFCYLQLYVYLGNLALDTELCNLIFDPTHVIKNIYNNFLTRRVLELPDFPPLVPEKKKALFTDVEAVYNIECSKPLKIAHKLSETVLFAKLWSVLNVSSADIGMRTRDI